MQTTAGTRGLVRLMLLCVAVAADIGLNAAQAPVAPPAPSTMESPAGLLEEGERLARGLAVERATAVQVLERALQRARESSAEDVEAAAAGTLGELLLNLGTDVPAALAHLERAAHLFQELERPSDAARVTTLAGIVLRRLGRFDEAEAAHRRALGAYAGVGDRSGEAAVLHNLGALLFGRSRPDEAVAHYDRSIALRREIGEVEATASSFNNLATIHAQRGDLDTALASHLEALAIADASGSRGDRAYATLGLGSQSFALGELQEAIAHLKNAATQFEIMGDRSGLGFARHTLGVVYLALGHDTDAVTILEQVLPLREHDPARLGTTLQSLAGAYRMRGQYAAARTTLERALVLKRQASDAFGEAATLRSLAALELDEGHADAARRYADAARAQAEQVKNPDGVALAVALRSRALGARADGAVLADLDREIARAVERRVPRTEVALRAERARAALRVRDLAVARVQVAEALARVEGLRSAVASLDLRATYLASQANLLDVQVDILLRSHEADPTAGYDRRAFEAADLARGRRMLDALGDATIPGADTNRIRARERSIEREVSVAALKLERASDAGPDVVEALHAQLDARLLALREFRAQARTALPWRRVTPAPDLARLQAALPADTAIVSYWLGSTASAAWVITSASAVLVHLAPGDTIRHAVREAYDAASGGTGAREALTRLAATLVHPLEPHLSSRRLAFVVDGELEYVPFAALPTSRGTWLVETHDVVRLPAAVWTSRSGASRVRPRTHIQPRIAVVADPVFAVDDGRVVAAGSGGAQRPDESRATAGAGVPARLRFSRVEAEAIASLARDTTLLTDFGASKAALTALPLRDLDVLHLATHADQHAARPDLSGIVLSLVDQAGAPLDGRMRLHEVVGLPLDGQTVVLSACQTLLGPDLRGDGLQGLARAFMQAGAGAVVASLWDVDDRATMVLMRYFYQALVRDGLTPDRALARAQRAMQADARWETPQHWAGFVVLGTGE